MQKLKRLMVRLLPNRLVTLQTLVLLLCSFMIFTADARVVIRFQDRSLFVFNINPGVTTKYTIGLTYTTVTTVGSLDMEFCIDPIPYNPCVAPTGLDLTNAVLSEQTGVADYTMSVLSSNHVLLSRTPGAVGQTPSTYTLDNVVNPTFMSHSFAIRLSDYASTDASGPIIDLGSVLTQITDGIVIETQVPPMMIFCVGLQVSPDCGTVTGPNYTDMGSLSPIDTLTATSQMAAGTNASAGYSIVAYGTTMQAGTHIIDPLVTPTASAPGNSQFGLNLVANTSPVMGADPDAPSVNAVVLPDYSTPNLFKFLEGDELATAPNVSLLRRFTVSYIVNSPPDIRPGVYTTTITYICTGRF